MTTTAQNRVAVPKQLERRHQEILQELEKVNHEIAEAEACLAELESRYVALSTPSKKVA